MSDLETRLVRYAIAPLVLAGIKSVQVGVLYTFFPDFTHSCIDSFKDNPQLISVLLATNTLKFKEAYDFSVDKTYNWIKSH